MLRLITQRKLARIANVCEKVVSQLCNGRLLAAKVLRDKRSVGINPDHPLIVEWLATHGVFDIDDKYCKIILTKSEAVTKKKSGTIKKSETKRRAVDVPEHEREDVPTQDRSQAQQDFHNDKQTKIGVYNVDDLATLTLREIIEKFGSIDGFKRFVESERIMLDNGLKEQKLNKARGELIDLDLVKRVVIDSFDAAFIMLVTDIPTRITQQVIAVVKTGGPDVAPDIERIYRDSTSTILKNLKTKIAKSKHLGIPK